MRHTPTVLALLSSIILAGCYSKDVNGQRIDSGSAAAAPSMNSGILTRLRPKVDPKVVEQLAKEDAARLAAQQAEQQKMQEAQNSQDGTARVLPKVSTEPFAPPAEEIAKGGPVFSSAPMGATMIPGATAPMAQMPQQVQTYGGYGGGVPPPPPGATNGMIPPPPVITVSSSMGMGESSPYANPYLNPYGIPFQQQQQPQMQVMQPAMAMQGRPSGSPFGGGGSYKTGSDDDESTSGKPERKPAKEFVPITPTGMEPRSAFKQRDELKVLWKGAMGSPAMAEVMSDGKFAAQIARVDVGIPGEASKGSLSLNQRMTDNIFRGSAVDRRILPTVKKVQTDVAQAYYRYLYSYNKFALAEQSLAGGKQEVEVANTSLEKQRAAGDLARAQGEVESAKDDMRSAQYDLAAVVGPAAARSVIGRVSGISPSLESLAQAQSSEQGGGQRSFVQNMVSPMTSLFHFGGGKKDPAQQQVAEQEPPKVVAKADNKEPTKREKDKKKESKQREKKDSKDRAGDLSPAPTSASSDDSQGSEGEKAAAPATSSGGKEQGIAFELKGVNVQPRKSILTVTIRNSGTNSYSFSPDVFNVSEGNRKLPEASVRTDFDQTMVQPNSEVKGTITIFGRPWNDKLAVVLADGSRTIQLRR